MAYDHGICDQVFQEKYINGELDEREFIKCNTILGRVVKTNMETRNARKKSGKLSFVCGTKIAMAPCQKSNISTTANSILVRSKVAMKFMLISSEYYRDINTKEHMKSNIVLHQLPSLNQIEFQVHLPALQINDDFSMARFEMFHNIQTADDIPAYEAYWCREIRESSKRTKSKGKGTFIVKAYRDGFNVGALPYSLVTAVDMGSFGCMSFQMLSGQELIPTDINQIVVLGHMHKAATWTDDKLSQRIETFIVDEDAQDLVKRLL
ncbi:hypothetical protein As57867_006809, partial [Aphanomyces stellatus]